MTEKELHKAEEVKKYGICTMLNALNLYCEKESNCSDCWYINESDDCCQVLEYILRMQRFPSADEVPSLSARL